MASFNKVILMGNLTRDPELRYTPKGSAVAKLGLAVNRVWRDAEGQQQDETTFVDVDAFGKQAETLGQYMQKGRPILVEGRLKLDQWEDKNDGSKRSKHVVVIDNFQFIDSRDGGGGGGGGGGGSRRAPQQSNEPVGASHEAIGEDDIPF